MTLGERIKIIRNFRQLTLEELGIKVGFEGKGANVRISQYESDSKKPRQEMILKLAEALDCNYKALDDYSLGSAEDIIETLFWLEESMMYSSDNKVKRFQRYAAPNGLITLNTLTPVNDDKDVKMTYNEPESSISGTPVAVTFNYGLVNDFLLEWNKKKIELSTGKITPEEYFEWKIKFPK